MDEQRKTAYRHLLYRALLDIRQMKWFRFARVLNPLNWNGELRWIRRAGIVADMLHNLAFFSAEDFAEFDEERFWRDVGYINQQYPEYDLIHYKEVFERRLQGLRW